MDSVTDPNPFPFFKLPPELRNIIYGLVTATGRTWMVRDMHPEEFKRSRERETDQVRSTYLATDHVCPLPLGQSTPIPRRCSFIEDKRLGPQKTTYTLNVPRPIASMATKMLCIDKRIRDEFACVFYGENTFQFTSMSSLMPFLKDRPEGTRKYIQRLQLNLVIEERDWNAVYAEYGRPATWNKAFSSVLKLPGVNIKKLCIHIDDKRGGTLKTGLNLHSRSMLWLHKLSGIGNLNMLGLAYSVGEWKSQYGLTQGKLIAPVKEQAHTETEKKLWAFLAPKMLKKETDDHSPEVLQQRRRILHFSHPCKSYRTDDLIRLVADEVEIDFDDVYDSDEE